MDPLEKLIDFLQEKGFELNSISATESLNELLNADIDSISIEIMVERQIALNNIIIALKNVTTLLQETTTNYLERNQQLHNYFDMRIKTILEDPESFDSTHALYGYKPFTDQLMVHFIKNEMYEACLTLKRESLEVP